MGGRRRWDRGGAGCLVGKGMLVRVVRGGRMSRAASNILIRKVLDEDSKKRG